MTPTLRRIILFSAFFILTTMFLGFYSCSGSGPADDGILTPDTEIIRRAHSGWIENGRGPLGVFHVSVDSAGGTPSIITDRSADFHVNITDYVEAPICDGCLVLSDFVPVPGGLSTVITLANPFPPELSMTAFDLRAVVLAPWDVEFIAGKATTVLMNADGYTDLYTSPRYGSEINPYINFGSEADGFTLLPGATDTRMLELKSSNMHYVNFDIIIDVSWISPSKIEEGVPISNAHCSEAYSIQTSVVANLSPVNLGVLIQGEILDWQDNAYDAFVVIDAPTIAGEPVAFQITTDPKSGDTPSFFYFLKADLGIPLVENPILISVIDPVVRPDGSRAKAHQVDYCIIG